MKEDYQNIEDSAPYLLTQQDTFIWIFKLLYKVWRRDNHAEGMVFWKRFYTKEGFSGGERPSKSVLKTYLRNLEKNIFRPKIYDFVIKIS